MPRSRGQRALSTGSYQEVASDDIKNRGETSTLPGKLLLQCLLHLKQNGNSFLHHAFDDIHMAKCLLDRCRDIDEASPEDSKLQERFLLQANEESGYNPLHAAIVARDLPSVLLYLQCASTSHVASPIALLHAGQTDICKAKDAEGLTPLELLGKLQISGLRLCRKELQKHALSVNISRRSAQHRSSSFDLPRDEDEEIAMMMQENRHALIESMEEDRAERSKLSSPGQSSYGFEVVTFGRPHHCALGVISGTKEGSSKHHLHSGSTTFRPQRVQEFAQERVLRDGSAIGVAASTHHTLVACRDGSLYVFGLNKGGRLGLGDDCPQQCPLPRQILALKRKRVVAIAAAENHSLCVTSDGMVWSWGNNQFGQLGDSSSNANNSTATGRSIPRPVEDLKQVQCSSVAAGERHSVALSQHGEVYVWGNNGAGQMGVARRSGNQKVQRVEALWNTGSYQQQRKVAIAIAAADQSTLVLTAPTPGMAQVNAVYWFGHGNHAPMKVHFEASSSPGHTASADFLSNSGMTRSQRLVNPVSIACGKYHNAAISSDGRVYTWGTSSESLGRSGSGGKSPSHRITASPQLVTSMLPENGGGVAVALSASDQHTAVVTDTGALFTWGVAGGKNAMGHEGVRWQPSPKRVPGVHRAVCVAVAKEHTVVLIGTTFPGVAPSKGFQSLEMLSALKVVEYIDLFNVLPILIMAEHTQCDVLVDFCLKFVRENLDGVLNVAKKSVLKQYLNDMVLQSLHQTGRKYRDGPHHPLISDIVFAGNKGRPTFHRDWFSSIDEWALACQELSEMSAIKQVLAFATVKEEEQVLRLARRGRGRRTASIGSEYDGLARKPQASSCPSENGNINLAVPKEGSIDRVIRRTANMDLSTSESAEVNSRWLGKEIRGVRKKLNQIAKLRESEANSIILTSDEQAKVERKSVLEAELHVYQTALDEVKGRIKTLTLKDETTSLKVAKGSEADKDEESLKKSDQGTSSHMSMEPDEAPKYTCDLCGIKCPDSTNFELHQNGRKHRNRLAQAAEEEKKRAAELIMAEKQLQQVKVGTASTPSAIKASNKNVWGVSATPPPKFKLPPPPHPIVPHLSVQNRNGQRGPLSPVKAKTLPPPIPSATHFQTILLRQQESKSKATAHQATPKPGLSVTPPDHPVGGWPISTKASPHAQMPTKSPSVSKPVTSTTDQRGSYSLADFLVPKSAPKSKPPAAATWASPVKAPVTPSPTKKTKSLAEIQAEESDFKAREDRACEGEKAWFMGRRERADSLHAIQEAAEQEREMQRMIQEQMEIEAQIQRDLASVRKKGKGQTTRNSKGRKPKGNQNAEASCGELTKPPSTTRNHPQGGIQKQKEHSQRNKNGKRRGGNKFGPTQQSPEVSPLPSAGHLTSSKT